MNHYSPEHLEMGLVRMSPAAQQIMERINHLERERMLSVKSHDKNHDMVPPRHPAPDLPLNGATVKSPFRQRTNMPDSTTVYPL